MEAFDRLPKEVRDAINDCPCDFDPTEIFAYWRMKGTERTLKQIEGSVKNEKDTGPHVRGTNVLMETVPILAAAFAAAIAKATRRIGRNGFQNPNRR